MLDCDWKHAFQIKYALCLFHRSRVVSIVLQWRPREHIFNIYLCVSAGNAVRLGRNVRFVFRVFHGAPRQRWKSHRGWSENHTCPSRHSYSRTVANDWIMTESASEPAHPELTDFYLFRLQTARMVGSVSRHVRTTTCWIGRNDFILRQAWQDRGL